MLGPFIWGETSAHEVLEEVHVTLREIPINGLRGPEV